MRAELRPRRLVDDRESEPSARRVRIGHVRAEAVPLPDTNLRRRRTGYSRWRSHACLHETEQQTGKQRKHANTMRRRERRNGHTKTPVGPPIRRNTHSHRFLFRDKTAACMPRLQTGLPLASCKENLPALHAGSTHLHEDHEYARARPCAGRRVVNANRRKCLLVWRSRVNRTMRPISKCRSTTTALGSASLSIDKRILRAADERVYHAVRQK